MAVAFLSAQRSKDPSKQVGACIVNCNQVGRGGRVGGWVSGWVGGWVGPLSKLRALRAGPLAGARLRPPPGRAGHLRHRLQRLPPRLPRLAAALGQALRGGRPAGHQVPLRLPRRDERHPQQKRGLRRRRGALGGDAGGRRTECRSVTPCPGSQERPAAAGLKSCPPPPRPALPTPSCSRPTEGVRHHVPLQRVRQAHDPGGDPGDCVPRGQGPDARHGGGGGGGQPQGPPREPLPGRLQVRTPHGRRRVRLPASACRTTAH